MRSIHWMVTATAIVSSGCAMDRLEDLEPRLDDLAVATFEGDPAYRPLRGAVDGRLAGDVGPISGIDRDANLLSAYDDGYYMSVETVVELQGRAVMTLLSVSNGSAVFAPGLSGSYALEDLLEMDAEDMQVTMLGCVGQDVGVYDEFDAPADEVVLAVAEGGNDDEMAVLVSATWYHRDEATGEKLASFSRAQTEFTLLR